MADSSKHEILDGRVIPGIVWRHLMRSTMSQAEWATGALGPLAMTEVQHVSVPKSKAAYIIVSVAIIKLSG